MVSGRIRLYCFSKNIILGGLALAEKKTEIMRVTPAEKALIEVIRQKGSEVVIVALGKILEGGLEIGVKKTDL